MFEPATRGLRPRGCGVHGLELINEAEGKYAPFEEGS